jgi:probable methylthioribulose-1-phosphate dehydratase
MFLIDIKGNVRQKPDTQKGLKNSKFTPLYLHIFQKRNAGAVIHSHALEAMLVTLCHQIESFRSKSLR